MKKIFSLLILLTLLCNHIYAQVEDSKNSIDIMALGNKGFASVTYNRTVIEKKSISFFVSPCIGYVPASREDTLNSIPRFLHLNIGMGADYFFNYNKLAIVVSYTKLLLGDPYHARPRSNYNRILGEISYLRYFKNDAIAIKISFVPILYDDGAEDVSNIPIGFGFRACF